jgi:hypothetical protein
MPLKKLAMREVRLTYRAFEGLVPKHAFLWSPRWYYLLYLGRKHPNPAKAKPEGKGQQNSETATIAMRRSIWTTEQLNSSRQLAMFQSVPAQELEKFPRFQVSVSLFG